MATLRYSQIRTPPGGTLQYIANAEKMLSAQTHDVYNVLNYMGEPGSVSRVYAFAHYCSATPALAEQQLELNRRRYYASKSGGVQGLKKDHNELVGLHFFLSYTVEDSPSQKVMDDILAKIADHPKLRNFPIFGAHHFDRQHRHTHFFVSQYSAVGIPRKLCMRHKDYEDLRKYINRLCVGHGLSIIDLSKLRWNDPEYAAWIDGVISSKTVVVHPETEEHKQQPKQKTRTRNLYYHHQKKKQRQAEAELQMLTKSQKMQRRFESDYYYTVDGDQSRRWYVTDDSKHRFYAVNRFSVEGDRRTEIELQMRFVCTVADHEGRYVWERNADLWQLYHVKVDRRIQALADCVAIAGRMHIEHANEVPARIAEVGRKINTIRTAKKHYEESLESNAALLQVYERYRTKALTENALETQTADLADDETARDILMQNNLLSSEAYEELQMRCRFEMQKCRDYEARLSELKKRYRALKQLEVLTSNPAGLLTEIYGYSSVAKESILDEDLETRLARARFKATAMCSAGNALRPQDAARERSLSATKI